MTALNADRRPWTPAYWIASTKGDALVLAPDAPSKSGLSGGRMRPTMKSDDVKGCNAPADLLGSCWQGFASISCFGCSKTQELSPAERKGGGDEHRRPAFKAVAESPRIAPVFRTNVPSIIRRDTNTVDNDVKDDEAHNGGNLHDSQHKLHFAISFDSKDLYDQKDGEEDGDPDPDIDIIPPVGNCDASCNFRMAER